VHNHASPAASAEPGGVTQPYLTECTGKGMAETPAAADPGLGSDNSLVHSPAPAASFPAWALCRPFPPFREPAEKVPRIQLS
jgi:hypothetical protein